MTDKINIPESLATNLNKTVEKFPSIEIDHSRVKESPCIVVNPEKLFDVLVYISEWSTNPMNYLNLVTAVDQLTHLEIIYFLTSIPAGDRIAVASMCPRSGGKIQSATQIWITADYHEREIYEFFGVEFENHPNLQRLLTPEEYTGFPLLKDYPKMGDPDDLEAADAVLPDGWMEKAREEKERLAKWLEDEVAKRSGSQAEPEKKE